MSALHDRYDTLLLDLDGVVYRGEAAVPHAIEALNAAQAQGIACCYVTNNASRTADEVAHHLRALGLSVDERQVVTSAQVAAVLVAQLLEPGSAVLALGGPAVAYYLEQAGFRPVASDVDHPSAVVQGYGPGVGWADLAEASYALARGVPWIATNTDSTFPTRRGLALGNGSLVAALTHATGRVPDAVAGKPEPALLTQALERMHSQAALMIGDRLDTDIAAGSRLGVDTLLVLTGVCTEEASFHARGLERPTWVGQDLRCLAAEPIRWYPKGVRHA